MFDTQYPLFNRAIAPNGYCWWYIDAESVDLEHRLTIIVFVGSVFSPYYKKARASASANPVEHCAINVALYGPPNRWSMTERHSTDIRREPNDLQIGPSGIHFQSTGEQTGRLLINIDERCAPLPRRIVGQIEVELQIQSQAKFNLDEHTRHHWWPAAPNSRIKVKLESPALSWHGNAYVDMNQGVRPIEADLQYWCWSRFRSKTGTYIHYDLFHKTPGANDPADKAIGIYLDNSGEMKTLVRKPVFSLGRSKWSMPRHARCDSESPQIVAALEDTPFYTRTAIRSSVDNQLLNGINESVSLKRFSNPVVQQMLKFRMPRFRAR